MFGFIKIKLMIEKFNYCDTKLQVQLIYPFPLFLSKLKSSILLIHIIFYV